MKKSFFSAIVLLLAAILFISACGGKGPDTGANTGGETKEAADEPQKKIDWRERSEEPRVVTIINREDPSQIFPEGQDIYDNLWTRRWKELYNIEVKTIWVSADYEVSLNLAIASKELPDMFYSNTVQFMQMKDANMLEDLTDVLDKYGSPSLKKMLSDEQLTTDTAMKNGKLYAIPQLSYGAVCNPYYLWIRKDWMEELGQPDVSTIANFEGFMKTCIDHYKIPYAIGMESSLIQFWASIPGWHGYPRDGGTRMWVDDGAGGIMSGYEMIPQMKEALATWAKWYENGWVRQDFATATWDNYVEDIVSGTTGMQYGAQWVGWTWFHIVENFGDNSYLECYDIPSVDGEAVHHPVQFLNWAYNVVTAGAKCPEALVILINDYIYLLNEATLAGDMTSEEVVPFNTNNMHHTTGPFKITFASYSDTKEVINAVKTGKAEFTTGYARTYYDELNKWITDKDITSLGRFVQMGNDRASLVTATRYEDAGLYLYTKAWGAAPQIELDLGSITDSTLNEGVTKIIMGTEPVDYYDQLIEEWRIAGGNDMKAAINKQFGK